ncbi:tyrosine-type recombinase/integrase [Paraburkholderia antibiotica]|uniref:Tyrosine-type recombinase/integrase n=1 Tax=Paraburkholderia antibiotica TaxID=2728839 RepID=A0A7Y0A142_9BURK|nr:tyrosine-type recombinase/integrase [Paraburkholderia antibiotica]NML34556.1 tyrosine-type recombinase/integrase [Paraburkholderia antibiotica]
MGRTPTRNPNLPPGMRARHRGKKTYYFYDWGGKPRREESLGTDFIVAVRRWSEIEEAQTPKAAEATLKEAFDAYIRDMLPNKAPRTQKENLIQIALLKEFFGLDAPLDKIEPVHIKQYMHWRHRKAVAWYESKKRVAPPDAGHVRANRDIEVLSHMFNYAREIGMTKAPNPCLGVKKNVERGRDVYVEDDLFEKVYAQADQPTRDAMDLAYLTGQRPQDMLNYDERDIRDGFIHLQQGKTKKKLRMEVSGELAKIIARIRARKASYKVVSTALIVNELGQPMMLDALQRRFRETRRAAGVPDNAFQIRDLRAKAGTDKTDDTGDIRQAQKQLGHTSVTMTEHYVRNRRGDKVKPTK